MPGLRIGFPVLASLSEKRKYSSHLWQSTRKRYTRGAFAMNAWLSQFLERTSFFAGSVTLIMDHTCMLPPLGALSVIVNSLSSTSFSTGRGSNVR